MKDDTIQDAEIINNPSNIPALPKEKLPDTVIVMPLAEQPFFPAQTQPLLMNELPWMESIKAIGDSPGHFVGLFFTKKHNKEIAQPEDFLKIGTLAHMHHPSLHEHKIQFIAEGIHRVKITKWLTKKPPFKARVEYIKEEDGANKNSMKAHAMAVINLIKDLIPLNPLYGEELKYFLDRFNLSDPSLLADFAVSMTQASVEDLQEVLEQSNILKRMEKVLTLLQKELQVSKLQNKIRKNVDDKMDEQQRKFFLHEQLKAIQQELGISKDDKTVESDKFKKRLDKLTVPQYAKEAMEESFEKLAILETGSPEYSVTRNHLDWLTALPWGVNSKDKLNLRHARSVLNRDHYGMDEVKDRIIEFLAVGKLKGDINGSIILLVGPPGVGKTSIGQSIAEALNRQFFRFSVGGMRDEAEIKGHRRTYIGAMPGKFIQAIKQVKTQNPVIMLDEIDKIGSSYNGNPASALLEVLDPEQNANFLDHYLDCRFDLSKVLFICTANDYYAIPGPLRDRMETIEVSGYIMEEKLEIAKKYLLPKQLTATGLKKSQIKVTDAAIKKVIEDYAREAGVRGLEKNIKKLLRKTAVKVLNNKKKLFNIGIKDIKNLLGNPLFDTEPPIKGIGTVTGLAWTSMGGATMTIESSLVHSKNRGFKVTGQLGDVMQESAEIAYSYISANLRRYHAKQDFFDESFVHLHVPAGATPKDGPSAGITMALALLSLAKNKNIPRKLAMTGELSLTGKVLPIGGLREKTIAARREKIKELIFPEQNRKDFEELPKYIKTGLKVHFVKTFDEVKKIVFGDK